MYPQHIQDQISSCDAKIKQAKHNFIYQAIVATMAAMVFLCAALHFLF